MSVTVKYLEADKSWSITTSDGRTYTAIDKNDNHRLDDGELPSALCNGKAISENEYQEAALLIAMDYNPTQAEIKKYNTYIQQKQEAETKKNEEIARLAENITEPSSTKKKSGFWRNFGNIMSSLLPILPLGLGIAGTLGSWSRSNNSFDNALTLSTIANMTTSTMMTMTAMNALNNATKTFDVASIGSNYETAYDSGLYGAGVTGEAGILPNVSSVLNIDNSTVPSTEAGSRTFMNNFYDACMQSVLKLNSANKKWVSDTIDKNDKTKVYTEEEIKKAQQIQITPEIDADIISHSGSDAKLSELEAKTIHNLIVEYKNESSHPGDKKFYEVMDKDVFDELTEILAKDSTSITPEEMERLKYIANNPDKIKRKKTEDNTEKAE